MKTAQQWADEMMGEYNTHEEYATLVEYARAVQHDERGAIRAEVEALRGERDRALSAARMLREAGEAIHAVPFAVVPGMGLVTGHVDAHVDAMVGVMRALDDTRWLDAADEKETT